MALLVILLNVLAPEAHEETEEFDVRDSVSKLHCRRLFSKLVRFKVNLWGMISGHRSGEFNGNLH